MESPDLMRGINIVWSDLNNITKSKKNTHVSLVLPSVIDKMANSHVFLGSYVTFPTIRKKALSRG